MITRTTIVSKARTTEMTFLNQLLQDIRRARVLIYIFIPVVTLLSAAYYWHLPNQYTARTKLMPVSGSVSSTSGLALSGMLDGFALAGLASNRLATEAALYVELLGVRPVVDRIVEYRFTDVLGGRNGTLPELWEMDNTETVRRKLLDICDFSTNPKTNVVTIAATTECPSLSAQIANRFAVELDGHKQSLDKLLAEKANTYFAAKVEQQEEQVRKAEDQAAAFYSINRNYAFGDDPGLKIEVERIERNMMFQRQVLAGLLQLEVTSDMEREKELPKQAVVEEAEPPLFKSGPRRVMSVSVLALMGALCAVGVVAARTAYLWYIPVTTRHELSDSCSVLGQDATHFARRVISPLRGTKQTGV